MVDEELLPPSDAKMGFVGWTNWDVAESGVDIESCSFSAGRSVSNNSVALRKGPPIAKELIGVYLYVYRATKGIVTRKRKVLNNTEFASLRFRYNTKRGSTEVSYKLLKMFD